MNDLIPISDDQAKAVSSVADFGKTLVNEASALARYAGRILGTIPEDVVGLVLGDPLRYVRAKNAAKYDEALSEKFKARRLEAPEAVSPSIAIPLLRAAYDESRPDLQALWASLMANAMDPKRASEVRIRIHRYFETVQSD